MKILVGNNTRNVRFPFLLCNDSNKMAFLRRDWVFVIRDFPLGSRNNVTHHYNISNYAEHTVNCNKLEAHFNDLWCYSFCDFMYKEKHNALVQITKKHLEILIPEHLV